jgi:hypothetical protein
MPKARRRPDASDRNAEEDGEDQRFKPGTTDTIDFDRLKQIGEGRDENAKANAREKARQRRDHWTDVSDDLIGHGHPR